MTGPEVAALTRLCELLAHPTRAGVLLRLRSGPSYPSELADHVGSSRSALSHHLAVLREHNLVVAHTAGRRLRCELHSPAAADTVDRLPELAA